LFFNLEGHGGSGRGGVKENVFPDVLMKAKKGWHPLVLQSGRSRKLLGEDSFEVSPSSSAICRHSISDAPPEPHSPIAHHYKEMRRARRGIQPGLTQGGIVFPGGGGRPPRYAAHVARVAVLTPFAFPSVRGNAITAERIVAGLRERGEEVSVWDLS